MVFCFVQNYNFFSFQNLTLGYMTKTLKQIFFSLHQNQNIFFSNIGNQNIFLAVTIENSGQIERHDALSFRSYSMSYTPPSHHALCLRTPLLVVHYVVHLSFRLCTMSSTSPSVVHCFFHLFSDCAICPLPWPLFLQSQC
jgi:hypothetical protein